MQAEIEAMAEALDGHRERSERATEELARLEALEEANRCLEETLREKGEALQAAVDRAEALELQLEDVGGQLAKELECATVSPAIARKVTGRP